HPFSISWLYEKRLAHAVRPCNYTGCSYHSHGETGLIKIPDILIKNAILLLCGFNTVKPFS
ncbi:hypothetical protein ASPACDRAFT_37808, partial [Aspergillus aculeatus ATCC 16872]